MRQGVGYRCDGVQKCYVPEKIRISLMISEEHDSELQSGPTSSWTKSSTPMAYGL